MQKTRKKSTKKSKDTGDDGGIILIDDVRNPAIILKTKEKNTYGKSKYAIPYLLENGYEIVEDEYQVILKKK